MNPTSRSQADSALKSALTAFRRGELDAAERACRQALDTRGDDGETLHLHGLIAYGRGDLRAARGRLEKAVAANPSAAHFHNSLGLVLRGLGEADEAITALQRALELRPRFPGACFNLGLVHEDRGDFHAALESYKAACEQEPRMAPAHHARGMALQALGRLGDARSAYRRALEERPDYPEAHFHLAHARRAEGPGDPQLVAIETLLDSGDRPPREAGWLLSAMGKLCDDLGRHDQAFEAYHRANRLAAADYDPEATGKRAAALIRAFPAEGLRRRAPQALARDDRIFIVGMPRSGTTLLEAMLATHPDVEAGGERVELPAALAEALPGDGAPPGTDPESLGALAEVLDRHLARPSRGRHLIDKLPGNVWHLGLIGRLMPRAPILFAWRDPRDIGLSCYFTRFERGQAFSYDLYHCGRHIRTVRSLVDYWLEALPNPRLLVQYERLVSDPEEVMREVFQCCGLEPPQRHGDHSRSIAAVTSASSRQVRQGLYTDSVGRWRRYAKHLGPLLDGLGSTGGEAGTLRAPEL